MRLRFWKPVIRTGNEVEKPSADAPSEQASEVFYDVAMLRLGEQLERRDTYSSRVAAALSVGATALPVTISLLTLDGRNIPICALVFLYASIVSFLVLVTFCLATLLPGALDLRPDMATLADHNSKYSEAALRRWIAKECLKSIQSNDESLGRYAVFVSVALVSLAIEATLLAIASLLVIS